MPWQRPVYPGATALGFRHKLHAKSGQGVDYPLPKSALDMPMALLGRDVHRSTDLEAADGACGRAGGRSELSDGESSEDAGR